MKSYYRVMLGKGSLYAAECFAGGFIGADFDITEDLSKRLTDDFREFNQFFIPTYQAKYPDKSKIAAGVKGAFLWTVTRGIQKGDIVLCPDGAGNYRVGEIMGDYYYVADQILPHRRPVHWLEPVIDRDDMSQALRRSVGSIGTVCNISRSGYADEVERLIGGATAPKLFSTDTTVEDASAFAMEKHLEDFLVQNWSQTEFGKEFDIYQEDGETVGQQYETDTGPLDVLAISKDKRQLLVVELKKGRASDTVVGQILRYMGYVQEELAEEGQTVRGVIIALDDDQRIRRALAVTPNISFYRYQISFKLVRG